MAILTKTEKYVAQTYAKYFGRAADAEKIKEYGFKENGKAEKASVILKNIIAAADAEKGLDTTEFVNNAFQNLFGRIASTKEMNKYSKVIEKGKNLPINSIVKSVVKADKDVYNNKLEVAAKYAELGGKGDFDLSKISKGNLIKDIKTVTKLDDLLAKYEALADNSNGIPSSFDGKTFVLTTSVDTGKAFVGTAKDDLFIASDVDFAGNATQTWSVADTIDGGKGIDTLKIVTAGAVGTTQFEDNTMKSIEIVDIKSTDTGALTLNTTADEVKNNFKDLTDLYVKSGTTTANGVTLTVNGTTNVTATTTAANTAADINVNGGKAVSATLAAAAAASAGTATIKGDALTTVTVKGGDTNVINNTDADGNTGAGETLKSVTLEANTTSNTISGNAIDTLTLKNQTGTLGTTINNDKSTALTVNLNNVAGTSTVTAGSKAETVTINSNGAKDNALTLVAAAGKTLNITGDAKLTLANASNAKDVVSTNTKGVTITAALGNDVKFTGGTGADSVKIGATTKAIDLGAGDDTATISTTTFAAGGSLNGGAGNDTLVVNTNGSAIAGLPHISGFETLRVEGAAAQGIHNATTFTALEVGTTAAASTFTNVAAGVGLTVLAAPTGGVTVTLANATGTADVFDLTLKSAGAIDAGKITIAGVETINIKSEDTNTTTHKNDIELVADTATSIVVTGDTGLDFVTGANSSATKVTNFDASALEGNVTFTSTNDAFAQAVTIKGATGNFVNTLTGGKANDTIIGGAGDDILSGGSAVGGAGVDTLTGGAGKDTFIIAVQHTKDVGIDKITDFVGGGVDTIKISTATLGTKATKIDNLRANDYDAQTSIAAAADTAMKAAFSGTGTTAAGDVVLFTYQSKVYAVVEGATPANGFTEGADFIVEITGVTGTVVANDFIIA